VKWINPDIPKGEERDMAVMVGEGGGIFALDRSNGQILWATPFPYDVPNFLISNIDGKTGKSEINWDLVFKKPGENKIPVRSDVDRDTWIKWARPVWYDINETDTLNVRVARDDADERHICPLQLPLIERCVRLWSNPGELVFSPFAGIGSEGYVALRRGRRFAGIELKASYWRTAVENLRAVTAQTALEVGA